MSDITKALSIQQLQSLHDAYVASLPSELQSDARIQQMQAFVNSGDQGSLLNLQAQLSPNATVAANVKNQLGDSVSFAALNPKSGQEETVTVPISKITIHPEMSGDKDQLVFKVHVAEQDTAYQRQIAEQVLPVVASLHPSFAASEQDANPVKAGSYRDDNSISMIANIPSGKKANEILAEILHPEILTAKTVVEIPAASLEQPVTPANPENIETMPQSATGKLLAMPLSTSAVERLARGATAAEAAAASGRSA